MNRKYWLLLGSVATVAGVSIACSSESHSCEVRRTCSAPETDAGPEADAGAAGKAVGTEPGGGQGLGGNRGEAGGDEAGGGGEGGESGTADTVPVLFGACSFKGALACVEHASAERLACDGERWQAGTTCAADQLCDSTDGKCAKVVAECASAAPGAAVCRGDTLLKCGADLVTTIEEEKCEGRCSLGKCEEPTCGDGKVENGEDCEDSVPAASGACVKCKMATCGDGVVYARNEQCDDGNLVSGDGCSSICRAEAVALALGDDFTCALASNGVVKCWGNNALGQLGLGLSPASVPILGGDPNTVPNRLDGVDLGSGRRAMAITARGSSACALLDNGEVKCWGDNSYGQLGTGDKAPRGDGPGEMGDALKPIPLGAEAKAISAGGDHTCALLAGGLVKCWGSHRYGQLGQGTALDALSPKDLAPIKLRLPATAISASSFAGSGIGGNWGGATCALLNDGTVECWGYSEVLSHSPSSDIDGSFGIGDYAGEMEALPALTFEGNRPAQAIAAGNVSAALLDDGSLRLWGWSPLLDGYSAGMSPAELASLPAVQLGKKAKSIAVERTRACAILEGGALKCWGRDDSGALGLGATLNTQGAPKDIAVVDLGGGAAVQVALGLNHTCAIVDDGTLRCWGNNAFAQLGLGDTVNRGGTGTKLSANTTVSLGF